MRMTLLVEVIILVAVGVVSIIEGIRLVYGGKLQLYDVLGPGFYNVGIGIILIIAGIIYFISRRRKVFNEKKEVTSKEYRIKMVNMVVIMAVYIFLMSLIGYLFASMVFFFLINRVVGFRSWLINGVASIGMAISFHIIFVSWMGMIFPRGVLLNF